MVIGGVCAIVTTYYTIGLFYGWDKQEAAKIGEATVAPTRAPMGTPGSAAWNDLHARFEMKRINHEEAYRLDGACTNWAEEFFSRMRRAEIGHHHHIAGAYLLRYAQEASWREDHRRMSNGDQVHTVAGLAMKERQSVDFSGYWQRHINHAAT